MSTRGKILWAGCVVVIITCTVINATQKDIVGDGQALATDQTDPRNTASNLVKLSHYIDLWHDAYLKEDLSKAYEQNELILDLLRTDLKATLDFVDNMKLKLQKARADENSPEGIVRKLESDVMEHWYWFKLKKRLLSNLTRTTTFSNKLRLLGDYKYALRREIDIGKIELVEEPVRQDPDIPADPNR